MVRWEGWIGCIGRDVAPNAPQSSDEGSTEKISIQNNLNCGDVGRVRGQECPRHIIKFKISFKGDGQGLP
jgi:hypothetical protein